MRRRVAALIRPNTAGLPSLSAPFYAFFCSSATPGNGAEKGAEGGEISGAQDIGCSGKRSPLLFINRCKGMAQPSIRFLHSLLLLLFYHQAGRSFRTPTSTQSKKSRRLTRRLGQCEPDSVDAIATKVPPTPPPQSTVARARWTAQSLAHESLVAQRMRRSRTVNKRL